MLVEPPRDMVTPETMNVITTTGIILVVVAMLVFAIRVWRSTGDRTGLLMLGGGIICSFNEPIVDIMGRCYFAEQGSWDVYEMFGRTMPVWLIGAYVVYFGGLSWLTSRALQKRPSRSQVYKGLLAFAVVDLLLEYPNLAAGMYTYYGDQPFELFGFPLAWLTINESGALLAAVLLVKFGHLLQGSRQWAILLLPVVTNFCGWVISLPHFYTINTNAPDVVKWAGSALAMGIGVAFIRFLVRSVTPEPEAAPARRAAAVPVSA